MLLGFPGVRQLNWAMGLCVAISIVAVVGCGGGDSANEQASSVTNAGGSASASGPNEPPIINEIVIRPVRPAPGREVRVIARVSDANGDPTTVEYRWKTAGGRELGSGRTFDTTGLAPGARLVVVATPSDGQTTGPSTTHKFRLSEPLTQLGLVVIDTSEGTKPGVTLESVVEVLNESSGRDEVELEWKVNGEVVGSEDRLDTGRFQPGDVVVLGARLEDSPRSARFVASPAVVLSRGAAPQIFSKPLSGIEAGMFRYQIRARSAEPDAELSYALMSGPDGMSVGEKSGLVSWRPTEQQRGQFEIEVSATDQWGSGIAQSFVIVAEAPASSPASPR